MQGLIPHKILQNSTQNTVQSAAAGAHLKAVALPVTSPEVDVPSSDLSFHRSLQPSPQGEAERKHLKAPRRATVSPGHNLSDTSRLSKLRKTPLKDYKPLSTRLSQKSRDITAPSRPLVTKPRQASSHQKDTFSERFERLQMGLPKNWKSQPDPECSAMRNQGPPVTRDNAPSSRSSGPLNYRDWFQHSDGRLSPLPFERAFPAVPSDDSPQQQQTLRNTASWVPVFAPLPWESTPQQHQAPQGMTTVTEQPPATANAEGDGVIRQLTNPFSQINYFQTGRSEPSSRRRESARVREHGRRSEAPLLEAPRSSSENLQTLITSNEESYPVTRQPGHDFRQQWNEEELFNADAEIYGEYFSTYDEDRALAQAVENSLREVEPAFARRRESRTHRQMTQGVQTFEKTFTARKSKTAAPNRPKAGSRSNPIDLTAVPDEPSFYGQYVESLIDFERSAIARSIREKENEQFQKASKASTRECVIDGESHSIASMPALADCTHNLNYCAGCYQDWLAAQLEHNGWREVKCPEQGCTTMLTHEEIQQYASEETFQRYNDFLARAQCEKDPNFRWCRACESGQFHIKNAQGNIFTCVDCGDKVCTTHNVWHGGETCDEYEYRFSGRAEQDQQRILEAASLATIAQSTKKCPGCAANIEKNEGCDHMRCKFLMMLVGADERYGEWCSELTAW
ncbi:hypothetical protein NX059_005161 [Plenodomus lindquistii]|nr:hypothetical protein NX059_005161 [Plenodomus lindquistii]